jgi:hypothetical protein
MGVSVSVCVVWGGVVWGGVVWGGVVWGGVGWIFIKLKKTQTRFIHI